MAAQELSALRFRPSLVIDAIGFDLFPEDSWTGSILRIGSFRMRLDKRDQRCVMVNTDPVGLTSNPAVLKSIGRERSACLGLYGSTVEPGEVHLGDRVYLES
ncbi:MAG: MOSC domain-containing protein [Acidobacteria bacterium]|nr:MOSC domain-containing protein [Acidobacteriota bacterium]